MKNQYISVKNWYTVVEKLVYLVYGASEDVYLVLCVRNGISSVRNGVYLIFSVRNGIYLIYSGVEGVYIVHDLILELSIKVWWWCCDLVVISIKMILLFFESRLRSSAAFPCHIKSCRYWRSTSKSNTLL